MSYLPYSHCQLASLVLDGSSINRKKSNGKTSVQFSDKNLKGENKKKSSL